MIIASDPYDPTGASYDLGWTREGVKVEASSDGVKVTKTVEVEDARGKTVKFELKDDQLNISRTAIRDAPIPLENVTRALRELGLIA